MLKKMDYYSYEDLLESYGHKILIKVDQDDYQGDSMVLFYNEKIDTNQKYGFMVYGWGSCSGCDALEGCDSNYKEVQDLADSMEQSITWFESYKDFKRYIDDRGKDSVNWYDNGELMKEFRSELVKIKRIKIEEILKNE